MLIQLAATGLLLALLPLTMVWASNDVNKYRQLMWVTLFLTFDLIVFGAFTRLTDSGLGCPDWPGCYGQASPWQAHAQISAAQALIPTGPVTVMKAWIEMIHRYLAMSVGVLIVTMMLIAWRKWLRSRGQDAKFPPGYPTLLLAFVMLQGAFGAWTVTLKLQPVIVTMHLLLGMGLLALLAWGAGRQVVPALISSIHPSIRLRKAAGWITVLLFIQIALGGWVSTNYATLACSDFPKCNGVIWPEMDFANGFTLWRDLGKTATGAYLPFPALTAIHWVHRTFAFVVFTAVGWLAYQAFRVESLRKIARWILIALCLQFVTGVATIFLAWPLGLAVAHNAGAALLVLLLIMLNCQMKNLTGMPCSAS